MRHSHRHAHLLERQKMICPAAEICDMPCSHARPHIEIADCYPREHHTCPECIKTQEVIPEEEKFFQAEEFTL